MTRLPAIVCTPDPTPDGLDRVRGALTL